MQLLRNDVPSEDEDENGPPLPKRQPLSLEDMIAKKEAEAQAQAKVLLHHCYGIQLRVSMLLWNTSICVHKCYTGFFTL